MFVPLTSTPSLTTDSLHEENKARRDDRPSFSLLSTFSGECPDEEALSDDFTIPRKVHYHSNWKHDPDAVFWAKLSRTQGRGLGFWQTKSSAIIVHDSQQQQPLSGSASSLAPGNWTWNRDVKSNTTKDPGSSSFRKLERNSVSLVDKKPKCEIDLRVVGVPKDVILKDEEQMKNQQNLEKLKTGSCTKSIRNDLKKKGDMIFSEESSRVIYEMGNLELNQDAMDRIKA